MLRALLARGVYYLRRVVYARGVLIEVNGARFRVGFRSNVEFKRARNFPSKEEKYVSSLMHAAENASIFWDIGANIGLFSLSAAHLYDHVQVYAFEPELLNYDRLVDNVKHIGFSDRIVTCRIALGAQRGRVVLQRQGDHTGLGGHAILADADGVDQKADFVTCETGDLLVADDQIPPPDLVKVDVEGFELQVLRGMRQVLTEQRPKVFLELHPRRLPQFGDSRDDFRSFVDSVAYRAVPLATSSTAGNAKPHKQEHILLRPLDA